jgi:hypothetical protein
MYICFMPASNARKDNNRNAITAIPSLAKILPSQLVLTFSPLIHRYSEDITDREMLGTFVSFFATNYIAIHNSNV